jgi:hypothetical protein
VLDVQTSYYWTSNKRLIISARVKRAAIEQGMKVDVHKYVPPKRLCTENDPRPLIGSSIDNERVILTFCHRFARLSNQLGPRCHDARSAVNPTMN